MENKYAVRPGSNVTLADEVPPNSRLPEPWIFALPPVTWPITVSDPLVTSEPELLMEPLMVRLLSASIVPRLAIGIVVVMTLLSSWASSVEPATVEIVPPLTLAPASWITAPEAAAFNCPLVPCCKWPIRLRLPEWPDA